VKYQLRPAVVEAVRFEGGVSSIFDVLDFMEAKGGVDQGGDLKIQTPEGELAVEVGDWIVKFSRNRFCRVKDDVFQKICETAAD